jgi:hypothetical protein
MSGPIFQLERKWSERDWFGEAARTFEDCAVGWELGKRDRNLLSQRLGSAAKVFESAGKNISRPETPMSLLRNFLFLWEDNP